MADMRKTARQVLDEAAAAEAQQTPGEAAALKRYGATGGTRSAEWIQKNLGAAGLTSRELASRYYVPGVKDAEPAGEVSRGRTGVTLAQVMALPKGDLDRAAAMVALTAAELDTRRYARMVTEAPKEVARSTDAVNTVAKLAVRADLTPEDEGLMASYVSGLAMNKPAVMRRLKQEGRQDRFSAQEARYIEEIQKGPAPVAGGEERPPRQPYPRDSSGPGGPGGPAQEGADPAASRPAVSWGSYPPSALIPDFERTYPPVEEPSGLADVERFKRTVQALADGATVPSSRIDPTFGIGALVGPYRDEPRAAARRPKDGILSGIMDPWGITSMRTKARPSLDPWDVINPGVPRTGNRAVDSINAAVGILTLFGGPMTAAGGRAVGADRINPAARGKFTKAELKDLRVQAKAENWHDPFRAAKALYKSQVDELPMLSKSTARSIKVDPYEAAKARKWLADTGQTGSVFTEPVTETILRYKKVKVAEAVAKRSSILY